MQILCEECGEVIAKFDSNDFEILKKAVCLNCHEQTEDALNALRK